MTTRPYQIETLPGSYRGACLADPDCAFVTVWKNAADYADPSLYDELDVTSPDDRACDAALGEIMDHVHLEHQHEIEKA